MRGSVITFGYDLDYVVGSILIYLYAKQGDIDNALGLFERMSGKDVLALAFPSLYESLERKRKSNINITLCISLGN